MTENLKIGETRRLWITGDPTIYVGEIVSVEPLRVRVDGWPMLLKHGDVIFLTEGPSAPPQEQP